MSSMWKRASTIPLYKGGNKVEVLNYRSVFLTSAIAKIYIERD